MCHDHVIRRFAGAFILLSVVLVLVWSPLWLAFTAFVGLNLIQSSVTAFCPLEQVLARVGFPGCGVRRAG